MQVTRTVVLLVVVAVASAMGGSLFGSLSRTVFSTSEQLHQQEPALDGAAADGPGAPAAAAAAAAASDGAAAGGPPCPSIPLRCKRHERLAGLTPEPENATAPPKFFYQVRTGMRTGNTLAHYWNGRAMVALAGAAFEAHGKLGLLNASWMAYLPRQAPAPRCPSPALYQAGCLGCMAQVRGLEQALLWPHTCNGHWSFFREAMRRDTPAALERWSEVAGLPLARYEDASDVAIQFRCADDTLLSHPEYGPLAYSCYKVIPNTTRHIRIVADKATVSKTPQCGAVLASLKQHLSTTFPSAKVSVRGGTIEQDFSALMRAPILIREGQSSFSLFAGMAGNGTVYSHPLFEKQAFQVEPDLGPEWRYLDCPILYPHVARAANVTDFAGAIAWQQAN